MERTPTQGINFDYLPGTEPADYQEYGTPPPPKQWPLLNRPKFNKKLVKVTHVAKKQNRITLPAQLIEAYGINQEFSAYFILYRITNSLVMILSKNNFEDADFCRVLSPIGVGLFCTSFPVRLLRYLDLDQFPDYVWLVNTPKSTDEDIVLEVRPT